MATRTRTLLPLVMVLLALIAVGCSSGTEYPAVSAPIAATNVGAVDGPAASTFSAVISYDATAPDHVNIYTQPYVAYIGDNKVWRVDVVIRDTWSYSSYQITANLDQIDQATTTVGLNTGESVKVTSPDGGPQVLKLSLVPGTYRLLIDGKPTLCTITIIPGQPPSNRSEERRVGKECCGTCRSRWSPYH